MAQDTTHTATATGESAQPTATVTDPDLDAIAAAIASAHPAILDDADDAHNDRSPQWEVDLETAAPHVGLVAHAATSWSPAVVRYLLERGVSIEDYVSVLDARPVWVAGQHSCAPGAQHQMFGPLGPEALLWTLAPTLPRSKLAPLNSGHAITIAVPGGLASTPIASAKRLAICEGPVKAAAVAISTGLHAVAGHGVAFGRRAWDTLIAQLASSANTKRPLAGRTLYLIPDAGDIALGHCNVAWAEGRIYDDAILAGARIYRVAHTAPTQKYDVNDFLRDHGPAALQVAIDTSRRVVRHRSLPTRAVREGRNVELLQTTALYLDPADRRRPVRYHRAHVIYDRHAFAAAARLIPSIARPLLGPTVGHADSISLRAPLADPDWAERLATRFVLCGSGYASSRDRRGDIVVRPRRCNALGCVCGAHRAMSKVRTALGRLAAAIGGASYQVIGVVRPLGRGPRDRDAAVRHADLLAEAQDAFRELRRASSVAGAFAWQRTEAYYGEVEGCVVSIAVAASVDAVRTDLPGWMVAPIGPINEEKARGIASWQAGYGGWRVAPEVGITERARILVDEYLHEHHHAGSLVCGVLHGNALNSLERRAAIVNATLYGPDDAAWAPPPVCVCGLPLTHEGDCDTDALRADAWTPMKRYRLAGAPRWLSRAEAIEAAAARATGEAFAAFAAPAPKTGGL